MLNLEAQPHTFASDQVQLQGHVVLSTYLDRAGEIVRRIITLRGDEGVIATLA
jgi:hypothetical protein